MLSKLGKFSTAVIIAGGATLLQSEPASAAASMEPCTASQESDACTGAQSYWQEVDGGYMCGQYEEGTCTTDGEYVYFSINYYFSAQACPPVQAC